MSTTTGGLANNGAVPTTGKVTGVLAPNNPNGIGTSAQTTGMSSANASMVPQGTNPGLLNSVSPNTHTITTNSTTGATTAKPTPNPSVLAQQQSLNQANKNTAGYVPLVEDGIAGPKTSAAIAQYGYNTQTGQPNNPTTTASTTPTQTPSPTPTTPQVGNASANAQTVLNSGNQTPQEQATYQGLLNYGTGTESPEVTQARQNLLDAQKQFAQQTSDINQSGTWTSRALGEQGQANIQNSNTLNALSGTLNSALTSQGQQIGALGTANSAAQTTAQRGTSTAGTVLNDSLLSPTAQGQASYSGLNGYQGGASNQFGNPNDPATAANAQAYQNYYNQYNAGLGGINQATAAEPNIINTITSNPQLNSQPISAIQDLNLFLSGQTSQPGQQQLSTDVANYIKNLGIDPATLQSNIASQQSGTLIQLLNNLKTIATKNNNALKTTADSLKTSSSDSTTGDNSTSGFGWNG